MRPPAHGLSSEEIAEWVRASRAAQGLPEKVTDPEVLRKVARIIFDSGSPEARAAARRIFFGRDGGDHPSRASGPRS